MKTQTLLSLCGLLLGAHVASAQNTAFTYQGFLNNAGTPAGGPHDLQFRLYGSSNAGPVLSAVLTMTNVAVSNGLFSLSLDFGTAPFNGQELWMNVAVRNGTYPPPPAAPPPYVNLDPRVKLGTVPHAIFAGSAATVASNGVTTLSLQNGSITAAKIASGNVVKSLNGLSDFVTLSPGSNVTVTTTISNIIIGTTGSGGSASNAWLLLGNAGTTAGVNFLGTTDNQPVELKANSQRALRIEPNVASSAPNLIGGSVANVVDSGAVGATIGGGGAVIYLGETYSNRVSALFGVIGGGGRNTIQPNASSSTIGGGVANTIQPSVFSGTIGGGYTNTLQTNAVYSTIAGGINNTVRASSRASAVGGGELNAASGVYNTIAGGRLNSASGIGNTVSGGSNNVVLGNYGTISGGEHNTAGTYGTVVGGVGNTAGYSGTVVGGRLNTATGDSAVALGNLAAATHTGSFVYSDYIGTPFASTADNQFSIRAGGGVRLDDSTSMSFGATTRQMLNLYHTDFGVGVQDYTFYSRTGPDDGFAWYAGGVHSNYRNDPGAGGTRLMMLQPGGLSLRQGLVLDADELNTTGDFTKGLLFGTGSGEGIVSKRSPDFANSGFGLDFYASNLPRLTIQNGGNVGIGTQSPGAKLHVVGTVKMDGLRLGTATTDGSVLAADGAGNGTWNSGLRVQKVYRAGALNTEAYNLIGGYNNVVANGTLGATALGGGFAQFSGVFPFPLLAAGSNYVSGDYASAIGGLYNVAAGQYSFAAGHQAKALHIGSFVWADSQNADFSSTTANEFSIRAAGGVRFSGGGPFYLDADAQNVTGALEQGMVFGGVGSGEGVSSTRANTGNAWGLDFYTLFAPRLSIANNGNVGIGTQSPQAKLEVVGTTRTRVLEITGGADLAEPFTLSGGGVPKGALVIIDEEHTGQLKLSDRAYDSRVAGIVSGANGVNPGITLHQEGVIEGSQNVALSGRVYALADASEAPIKPGDLLTSSTTPGHVMKASDHNRAQGAIVGKAMSSLRACKGYVLVLVSLQ